MLQGIFLKSHFWLRGPLKISDPAVDKMTVVFAMESEIKVTLSAFPRCRSCASSALWAGLMWGLQGRQGPARTPEPGHRSRDGVTGEALVFRGTSG